MSPWVSGAQGQCSSSRFPSDSEKYDNIVAFWVPAERSEAGKEWQFAYRMSFFLDTSGLPPGGRTYATRTGVGGFSGESEPDKRKFVIDFMGGRLSDLDPTAPVEAVVTASTGRIDNQPVQRNDFIGGWRVFFDLKPEGEAPVESAAFSSRVKTPSPKRGVTNGVPNERDPSIPVACSTIPLDRHPG